MAIKVRQICFILLAYTAVTKLLVYPTVLADVCGRDLLAPALIDFNRRDYDLGSELFVFAHG